MRSYNRLTQAVLRRPVELGLDAPIAGMHQRRGRHAWPGIEPCSSASSAKSLRSELDPRPPTMRRETTSITNATYATIISLGGRAPPGRNTPTPS